MAEVRAREAEAEREAVDHRSEELARWHTDDVAAGQVQTAAADDAAEPALADSPSDW